MDAATFRTGDLSRSIRRGRGVEDGELGWVATGDSGLLGQGAGEGVVEPFALVQERAW